MEEMLSCTAAWNRCTSREPLRHQSDSSWRMANGTKFKTINEACLSSPWEELQKHIENVSPPVKSFKQVIYNYVINILKYDQKLVGSTILNVWTCVSFLAAPPYSPVVENTFCTNPLRCFTDRQPSKGFSRQRKRQQIQFDFSDGTYVNDK